MELHFPGFSISSSIKVFPNNQRNHTNIHKLIEVDNVVSYTLFMLAVLNSPLVSCMALL